MTRSPFGRLVFVVVTALFMGGFPGCEKDRDVTVPAAAQDAPPAIRIINVITPGNSFISDNFVDVNGFVGKQTATKTSYVTADPYISIIFLMVGTNTVGGVKDLKVEITSGTNLLYAGQTENVIGADGKAPTRIDLWGTQSASGPVAFLVQLNAPITVAATASNFTGGVSTLTEIVSLRPEPGPSFPGTVGSGNAPGCQGSAPTGSCMVTTPEGCEVPGHYACTKRKYECSATANVDYCTTCGQHGSLNCGTCATQTCGVSSQCAPGILCLDDPNTTGQPRHCRKAPNDQCPAAKCWLPKNLGYDRTKCFSP